MNETLFKIAKNAYPFTTIKEVLKGGIIMDKILIHSKFMKSLISKIVQRSIRKGSGVDTLIDLNYVNVDTDGEFVTIQIDGSIKIRKEDFVKIVMKEL